MNKRLFTVYTVSFILIGIMLYLYRSNYNNMRIYTQEVNSVSEELIKLERIKGWVSSWMTGNATIAAESGSIVSSDILLDSIIANLDKLANIESYDSQKKSIDTLHLYIFKYQYFKNTKSSQVIKHFKYDEYRYKIINITNKLIESYNLRLEQSRDDLAKSTRLLDQWLMLVVVLLGIMLSVATFYSFKYFRQRIIAEGFNLKLLETTNYGIVSFLPVRKNKVIVDYKITYCNEAALRLLHIEKWKNVLLSNIVSSSIFKPLLFKFNEVIVLYRNVTLEGYLDTGTERNWLQVSLSPLGTGLLSSVYNLNPVKLYEQKLTHKIKQLEMLNDELKQYAFVTSHDLQEPLRKIQTFVDMALNPKDEINETEFYLNKVRMSADRMRELIQTLLIFTQTTDQQMTFVRVNLEDVLHRVIGDLELMIDEYKATIQMSKLPHIEGSSIHLSILFHNILMNSLKYSKPDIPPLVRIEVSNLTQKELLQFPVLNPFVHYIRISVKDNGVGFKSDLANRMFTIFQRLYNKTDTPGAGIGLAICKKIVYRHQGHIYAEGIEGEGAVINVVLPVSQSSYLE